MTLALIGLFGGVILIALTIIGGITTIEQKVDEVLKLLKGRE